MTKLKSVVPIYGLAHLLVDAICISGVLSLKDANNLVGGTFITLIILYNIIAFGTQPLFGFAADYYKQSKYIGLMGILIVFVAFGFMSMPYILVLLTGIGNAMFHVGGGIVSLYATPNKATAAGVFVAPGAIGVFIAPYISDQTISLMPLGIILLLCALILLRINYEPEIIYDEQEPEITNRFLWIIIALLLVICVRSIIGGALVFIWKSTLQMKLGALTVVVLGKAMGGILGDKYGFKVIGVGGLLISSVLLSLGMSTWFIAIIGLFAFNVTMPITLTALSNTFRRYKGFAFGLTTLAIVIGYLLNRYLSDYYSNNKGVIIAIILLSAVSLYFGLKPNKPKEAEIECV